VRVEEVGAGGLSFARTFRVTVTAVNEELRDKPEAINAAAFDAWMYKLKPASAGDLAGLMDAAKYQANVDAQK